MENRWKEIWDNKGLNFAPLFDGKDTFSVYKELKKMDGFDVSVEDAEGYYRSFFESEKNMWVQLQEELGTFSAYEVGCGCGANLYLLQKLNINECGGMDYSRNLINIARKVVNDFHDISVDEAINIDVTHCYDIVFSDSVFPYFKNVEYGMNVLEKMYLKARKLVIVQEVLDESKKRECMRKRYELYDNYSDRYAGLDKTFYSKELFNQFAESHHCKIRFSDVNNKYYWNSEYMFNCFLEKK